MKKLSDRVAIVTGGGQGLGRAYAFRLAEDGAKIIIAELNEEKGKSVEEELLNRGHDALFVKTNVVDEQSVQEMVNRTVNHFGKIDILVNNAAIFTTIPYKPFEDISIEEWNTVMNVNVTGVFICCQKVIPVMRSNSYGRIVNVSSSTVMTGREYFLHYVASKSAIIGLTRSLAREVGKDNINVNTIAPGNTMTEVKRKSAEAVEERVNENLKKQSIQRPSTADDMAGVVSFLCSDDSKFMTGQLLLVDGGKAMH